METKNRASRAAASGPFEREIALYALGKCARHIRVMNSVAGSASSPHHAAYAGIRKRVERSSALARLAGMRRACVMVASWYCHRRGKRRSGVHIRNRRNRHTHKRFLVLILPRHSVRARFRRRLFERPLLPKCAAAISRRGRWRACAISNFGGAHARAAYANRNQRSAAMYPVKSASCGREVASCLLARPL